MALKPKWQKEELAIVIFFRSRSVSLQGCTDLLSHKTHGMHPNARTLNSVTEKLSDIRHKDQLFSTVTDDWDLNAVDCYLRELGVADLPALTSVGPEELDLMGNVCSTLLW